MRQHVDSEASGRVEEVLAALQGHIVALHQAASEITRPGVRVVVLAGSRIGCDRVLGESTVPGAASWCVVPTEVGILNELLRVAGHPEIARQLCNTEPSAIGTVLCGRGWIAVVELHPTPEAEA